MTADDCRRCDLDRHSCAGCGVSVPHGTEVCTECSQSEDAAALADALDRLAADTDSDPCWFDHHGHCQAHDSLGPKLWCADREAHELLIRIGKRVRP